MKRNNTSAPPPLLPTIAPLPGWIAAGRALTSEEAAFLSGAALAHLHAITGNGTVPQALWRDRLALAAALVCAGNAGRREGEAGLRDALLLTRAGDDPGPAGAILRQWSRAAARPISVAQLGAVSDGISAPQIAALFDSPGVGPVARAALTLETVLSTTPRAEVPALILAEAVLAKALGWGHLLPLLSLGLKPRDMSRRGEELRLACHRAVVEGVRQAVPLAADLARRAARLGAVVPRLRAKGAERAVDLFLSRDALAPGALSGFMSDRAARRLCDRLVALTVLRELTGRESFRLYGL